METFSLESEQSFSQELAKHDPFSRPEVVFGVYLALCDLVHPFSPKVAALDLEGGGGKIEEDLFDECFFKEIFRPRSS